MSASPTPWLARPRLLGIVSPMIVGALLLGVWQLVCIAWHVPVYLVPSPLDILRTLIADGPMLAGALWVTVKSPAWPLRWRCSSARSRHLCSCKAA
ncbi:hypothetical protein [Pseudomonas sp. Marseille-Q5115]|uniref:hypothetical protein n=1 Tax=Pseudomonas sp. Marseille-Q5115 TaxID=2866593 RepID=UPI0021F0EF50|nr:hypothetical protein [Pseudomonas sp. Marseille-Q5115]